jgi:uncharacterized membrane protein
MKNTKKVLSGFLICFLFIIAVLIFSVEAQNDFTSQVTQVKVYNDGLAHITQTLTIDELKPDVTVSLISASVENFIVLDTNKLAVDYELTDSILKVFSLGATQITIEYDTTSITNKQAEVWTLILNNPYNLTVFLPNNSTIVYLNQVPTVIDTSTNQLSLVLPPNHWEISYTIPLQQDDGSQSTDDSTITLPIQYLIFIIIVVVVTVAVAMYILTKKRKINPKKTINRNPHLSKEDKAVIEFLAEKDGKAFEAEIRQRFPEMPRTSLWRLIKRLEKSEIIEVERIGLENQVKLKK